MAPTETEVLCSVTESTLQKQAPLKQRLVRGNNKPHVKADLRKAIMTRSRLKKGLTNLEKKKTTRNMKNKET